MGFVTNSAYETATLTVGNTSGANYSYGGTLQNNLKLVKVGSHVLQLTAANTYIGSTDIEAGTLEAANSSGSATGIGPVHVKSGATLAGGGAASLLSSPGAQGLVAGRTVLSVGGAISPGAVAGGASGSVGVLSLAASRSTAARSTSSSALRATSCSATVSCSRAPIRRPSRCSGSPVTPRSISSTAAASAPAPTA